MTQRPLAIFAVVAGLALAAPALADPAPAAAPAAATPPPDVPGAVALLSLFSVGAKPEARSTYAAMTISIGGSSPARTQMVCVSGQTYSFHGMVVREVWSYAEQLVGPIDSTLALRLMAQSDQMLPSGSWVAPATTDGSHYIEYETFVPVNADAATVAAVVTDAVTKADKLELELTNKDQW